MALLAIALAWLSATPAAANNQTFSGGSQTWTGYGANNNWSTPGNWTGALQGGEQLTFGSLSAGAHASNNNDWYGRPVNGIVFSANAATYDLKGQAILLGNSVVNNSAKTQTISLDTCLAGGNYTFSTAPGDITVNGAITPWDYNTPGGILKTGSGTLLLNGYFYYQCSMSVLEGTLKLGSPEASSFNGLTVGSSGTVDLNGFNTGVSLLDGSPGGVITDNSMPASIPIPTMLTASNDRGNGSTFGGGIVKGINGQDIALTKSGSGTLTLSGNSNYSGGTYINEGKLNVTGTMSGGKVVIASGATLSGSGAVNSNILGFANSSIVATGDLTLGDSTSYTGFHHAGKLTVGANHVTLNSAGFANLGALTTISGGSISAPNGVSLGVGCNLSGSGIVNAKVAAGHGSTINATGNLTLGDSTKYDGFVSDGELYVNQSTVTLYSKNAANNRNAVVLGALTQMDGGRLVAPNGILLENGKNLVTTDAGGTVSAGSGPSTSRFLNRGAVQGPSSSSSDWLTFNMPFKGSTGSTSGRIAFLGGFATGDSPGVNTQYGATLLGGTGTEFDIGGRTPGNGDNNYGQLNILTDPSDLLNHGDLTLLSGTILHVVDWNGFVPTIGDQYTILTWDGSLSGNASLAIDPSFANAGIQFIPEWNAHSLVLDVVPEPSTLILLVMGIIPCLAVAVRRRRRAG